MYLQQNVIRVLNGTLDMELCPLLASDTLAASSLVQLLIWLFSVVPFSHVHHISLCDLCFLLFSLHVGCQMLHSAILQMKVLTYILNY